MKYYIQDRPPRDDSARTAFSKARADAETICARAGWRAVSLPEEERDWANAGLAEKLRGHVVRRRDWAAALAPLGEGDILFLQLPILYNCVLLPGVLRRVRSRGARVVALVHDLELMRQCLEQETPLSTRLRMGLEEKGVLRRCDRLIVHNEAMAELLGEQGLDRERMIPLGIFDYLLPEEAPSPRGTAGERRLIVAGNLSPEKAGYVYDLAEGPALDLYGVRFEERAGMPHRYHGSYTPEELPGALTGGFGLVWDGPRADTCAGVYGEYLRYNDPHKTSLYLAAGLPVAIWEEAALAALIRREGLGITAPTVAEAARRVRELSQEGYRAMAENAARFGAGLRRGDRLRQALAVAEK